MRGGRTTNCGCVRMEKMRQATIKDETGKEYGFLHVDRIATEEEKPRANKTGVYWSCTCKNCGRTNVIVFGDYLRNGDTTSCGCIQSKNEAKIAKILDKNNIKYISQYWLPDLYSFNKKDKLYFDFAIFNNETLLYIIEYDGIQHFEDGHFHGNFAQTRSNDIKKNKYCFEHNIPIIRIPYCEKYKEEDLYLQKTNFLLTENNEKDYYIKYTKVRAG